MCLTKAFVVFVVALSDSLNAVFSCLSALLNCCLLIVPCEYSVFSFAKESLYLFCAAVFSYVLLKFSFNS